MNKYIVHGEYTLSFDVEVLAESEEDAIQIGEDLYFWESSNNGIFCDGDVELNADGMVDNVSAKLKEEDVDDESDCDE